MEVDRKMGEIQSAQRIEEHIKECQHRIKVINRYMQTGPDASKEECIQNIQSLEMVISALQESQQYRQIGTVEKCNGYKIHSQNISKLHNCNDCGKRNGCEFAPRPGEICRINCYMWEGEDRMMDTERMIRELKREANKHRYDTLRTFDTNITALCSAVIPKLEQLKQYEAIGTVDECRAARAKQEPMKVTDIHVDEYYCPACRSENNCDQGQIGDKYCPECGQAID